MTHKCIECSRRVEEGLEKYFFLPLCSFCRVKAGEREGHSSQRGTDPWGNKKYQAAINRYLFKKYIKDPLKLFCYNTERINIFS